MSSSLFSSNPKQQLKKAIDHLEDFTCKIDQRTEDSRQSPSVKAWLKAFGDKPSKGQEPLKQHMESLKQTIKTIKTYFPLVEQLKNGSEVEQALAARAVLAIKQYNERAHKEKEKPEPLSMKQRLEQLLMTQFGLSQTEESFVLPKIHVFTQAADGKSSIQRVFKSYFHTPHFPTVMALPDEITHCYRMKAIRVMEKEGIINAFKIVHQPPLQASVSEDLDNPDLITLSFTWSPIPGQWIQVSGKFLQVKTTPHKSRWKTLSESFQMEQSSFQSGFPHPLQHTGWSLAHELIPSNPLQMEHLPLLSNLSQEKQKIAWGLLPKGEYFDHARSLLELKRQVMCEYQEEMKELHHKLYELLLGKEREPALILSAFFENLSDEHFFDELSHVHHLFASQFIAEPFYLFQKKWLKGMESPLSQEEGAAILGKMMDERLEALLMQTEKDQGSVKQSTLDFLLYFAKRLRDPLICLQLQQFSEVMRFKPPMLGDFERRLQLALYQQQHVFVKEVYLAAQKPDQQKKHQMKEYLKSLLHADIAIFEAHSFESISHPLTEIVEELEAYFNTRYLEYSLTGKDNL